MKNNKVAFFLICFSLCLTGCSNTTANETESTKNTGALKTKSFINGLREYRKSVNSFQRVNAQDIHEKFDQGDGFFVYVGRETCQYCRAFAPKLSKAAKNAKVKVYYLDVENVKANDKEDQFLKDVKLKYIPAVFYIDSDSTPCSLKITNSKKITVRQIENFLIKHTNSKE